MTIKYLKVISLGSKLMIDHKLMDYFEKFSHWYTILSRNINNEYNYILFDSVNWVSERQIFSAAGPPRIETTPSPPSPSTPSARRFFPHGLSQPPSSESEPASVAFQAIAAVKKVLDAFLSLQVLCTYLYIPAST